MDILAFGRVTQPTSAAAIITPYDQLSPGGVLQTTPQSVTHILTAPTFVGIASLVPQLNGSLRASWLAATGPNTPIFYDVYIKLGTATGLFDNANKVISTFSLQEDIFELADNTLLVYNSTYFVGVKARDALSNISPTTTSISAVSSGVTPNRVLTPSDLPGLIAAIWDELKSGHTVAGSFGSYLDAKSSEIKTASELTNTRLGTPVGSTFSADIQNIQADVVTTNTRLGIPVGASLSADTAAVKADAETVLSRLTPTRAANLDYLDASVSSRQSTSVALSQFTTLDSGIAGVLAAVQGIQNNTNFVAIVPTNMQVPNTGSSIYKFYVSLFDSNNSPEDPDSNTMTYTIINTQGTEIVAPTAMTRNDVGRFEGSYTVMSGAVDDDYLFVFTYSESTVDFTQYRTSRVSSESGDLNTLLGRLTQTRAENLDFLDVSVASRLANSDHLTRYNNLIIEHNATQTDIAALNSKVGTPVLGSVVADITAVRIQTDKIGSPVNGTLAADLSNLDSDIVAVKTVVDAISNSIENSSNFVGIVPGNLELPASGNAVYKLFANLYDSSGNPNDPNSQIMNYRIEDTQNNVIVATTAMTRNGVGQFETSYTVTSTDLLRGLLVFFEYNEGVLAFRHIYSTSTTSAETKLETLISRLTAPRAANLDNLDATVSTRATIGQLENSIARLNANVLVGVVLEDDEQI